MRLNSIKLAGFKSFADPTTLRLPGQLVGVVGPNGCGKSNIMDAVRWVLGESRASELRGESMHDVIFSGTGSRPPASRAAVELVFDNSDQRVAGSWGRFAEIAVKRVLTRDGGSSYHINGQLVRRRDVHDVFMGTGLGPRAYAIIGQGMIGRIIESRPEELRMFLEEAAGVSKYKERRREAERRLADTRANLDRVGDVLRELEAQLAQLERQAEVAQRYQRLQSTLALKQCQLWFLSRAQAEARRLQKQTEMAEVRAQLDARLVALHDAGAEVERLRQALAAGAEALNRAQGALYQTAAEVAARQAEIRSVDENRGRIAEQLRQIDAQLRQWAAQRDAGRRDLAGSEQGQVVVQQRLDTLERDLGLQRHAAGERESALELARVGMREADAAGAELRQRGQVLAAERRSVHEQQQRAAERRQRLERERTQVEAVDTAALADAQSRWREAEAQAPLAEAAVATLQAEAAQREGERAVCQRALAAASQARAASRARLEALRALQERLQSDGKLEPWLKKHGLAGRPQMWTRFRVQPGWERALEAALRERAAALEMPALDCITDLAADPVPRKQVLFCAEEAPQSPARSSLTPLAERAQASDARVQAMLRHWLAGCYAADSLDQALALRRDLAAGEVIHVPAGHAVGACSVALYAEDSPRAGLLARAREIESLEHEAEVHDAACERARTALAASDAACALAAEKLAQARQAASAARQRAHDHQLSALRLAQRADQAQARSQQLERDLAEVAEAWSALEARRAPLDAEDSNLDDALAQWRSVYEAAGTRLGQADAAAAQARQRLRDLERAQQEAQFELRGLRARQVELARSAEAAEAQIAALAAQRGGIEAELDGLSDAVAQAALQQALEARAACDAALTSARQAHDASAAQLRARDEQRLAIERGVDPLRQQVTELQLEEQAARLGVEQYSGLLSEAGADLPAVARSLAAETVELAGLQPEIDRLQAGLRRLGAVNLAALDELGATRERQTLLQGQSTDLQEAMTTLEDAIRRIDRETRSLLADTFAAVNQHFGRLFPELFGGGSAQLVMTGDEILDAGVRVMAQPPGKKNQTIQLLSGGEKALTAIALVFAIFELNPAPFCLLDEVDAPLDDANTGRYADLVARMSRQGTQFLFITHNRIAMEQAQQLIGVTMEEQGVSRIVAVDLVHALDLAAAAG